MSASKHWERRIPIYLIGMFLMTIGVNLSVLSGIGVSPIDTLPYIVSLIAQKSLGLCTTLVFSVYILLQIVILRRRFQWKNLLQIVLSIIFGWFVSLSGSTDGAAAAASIVSHSVYLYAVQHCISRLRYFSVRHGGYHVNACGRCCACAGRSQRKAHVQL